MWRRPLNSTVLVAATHKRLGRASDGTSIRVVAYIINKWRARISQKRIYNVRDPLGMGHREIYRENIIAIRIEIVSKFKGNILKDHSPRTLLRKAFFAQSLFFFTFLLSLIHYACCLIHWNLIFKPTLYKFICVALFGPESFFLLGLGSKPFPYSRAVKFLNNCLL